MIGSADVKLWYGRCGDRIERESGVVAQDDSESLAYSRQRNKDLEGRDEHIHDITDLIDGCETRRQYPIAEQRQAWRWLGKRAKIRDKLGPGENSWVMGRAC